MASSARAKVFYVLDIILRVPPLFVMDSILHKGYPYEYAQRLHNANFNLANNNNNNNNNNNDDDFNEPITRKYLYITSVAIDLQTLVLIAVNLSGFLAAFLIFILSREYLLMTYKWLFAIGTVLISYWSNVLYASFDSKTSTIEQWMSILLAHVLLQVILATTFCLAHRQFCYEGVIVALNFLLPSLLTSLLAQHYVRHLPITSLLLSLGYIQLCCLIKLPKILHELKSAIRRSRIFVQYYGLHALLENEWSRLSVPHVLRVFWLTRISEDVLLSVVDQLHPVSSPLHMDLTQMIGISLTTFSHVVKELLVRGCDTVLAVLGMTSVIASASHYFGYAIQQFLMTEDEEEKSIGTVSAVLFFVLALQTGLTGLEPEKRFVRLYRNFCLLFTAILHFVHNIVNPLLMSLSASRNRSVQRHSRVLAVCLFLISFPCWFLLYLWNHHSISTWLLSVSAFIVEVVIKVIISLLLYLLFMIDAYRNAFWEQLDDYIYYIRATGNTIEFVFGIFLFFNGAWILLFESGGAIRACMMCIHAYINIWLQAKAGWRTFMKRRTAVNKINALPEATAEQLQKFDDVCAICYQELTNARITKCNHYFHGVCLRKWLYVQDRCPLCHNTLYKLDSDGEDFVADAEHAESDEGSDEEEVLRVEGDQTMSTSRSEATSPDFGPSEHEHLD